MAVRTWFITGVSSGLGRLMAEQLFERGERVAGTARNPDSLAGLRAAHGDRFWLAPLDVTDTPAVRRVVDQAFAHFGRIDVVVNNAGYGLVGAAEELTDEQIVRQLNTNVIGSIQVVRAALPHLRAQRGGRIMQLSSMGGQWAMPGLSLYHASKWAVEGFFESTMLDVAPFGIQVTIVEPGSARTDFAARSAELSPALDAYADTPAGAVRRLIEPGFRSQPGDPAKMARAMIDSADRNPAPKRLALGSDAYANIRQALTERLAELDAQKDIATATDFED
ncbi:SDR family oxidoreductase [Paraburkholderia caballeronis]|uniref:Short-chain dehydrogenase n=1 Tax=Paraburkholderia caballeronis TaxID=416943 RepID=A0A1H7G5R2_9BURK|nr:SDR family oxidoreductase [Paraburkholderia caballeronis]PXW24699.1 short-subunit dehydrogenase [Paraburkholderia caballeronis]PXX00429.1 short-subunit dehydrogenase [Paraburkholderia caballeronis]RAJ98492.1 short-subunit dehydrogenase [Paraburkholderia caballeronis]SEE65043.1 Short-chain dehydrogenase [Paraburkholderia caballeronis]SEK33414.1 Short-chain dehydrogenase [Paraburkholderia caballeronis]